MINPHSFRTDFPLVPLSECVHFLDHKRRPITAKDRVAGPIPYFGANGIQDYVNDYIFDEDLILLAEDGGHFYDPDRGVAYRISGKSWVNNHAHVLKPKSNTDIGYLHRILENIDLTSYINGATRAKLTKAAAERIKIPLPPLAEQQRIAALLDTADNLLRLREAAIEKLDQLAESVFKDCIKNFNTSEYVLGDIAEMYQPKTISSNELKEDGAYVVYGANGVIGRYDQYNHKDSEVLVTCRGATCGTINKSEPFSWVTGNAMVVKPLNGSNLTKEFLFGYFKHIADFGSVITGAAQPQITRQSLCRLGVSLPKLEDQILVTQRLSEIENAKSAHVKAVLKSKALRDSLQHQSFAVN